MTVRAAYQEAIACKLIVPDKAQGQVIESLDHIRQRLIEKVKRTASFMYPITKHFAHLHPIKGLYIWGGVGVGKTYLLDLFFHELPIDQKLRIHFHAFMRDIHQQLTKQQGEKNPLKKLAVKLAKNYVVICFDEFFVDDIGDAMLLGNLFTALFEQGVTIIITSNVAPKQLYLNGLQRELFLPAIIAFYSSGSLCLSARLSG